MKSKSETFWNCLIGWLASFVFLLLAGFIQQPAARNMGTYWGIAVLAAIVVFGLGLPTALLVRRRYSRSGKAPHPVMGILIGAAASQILVISFVSLFFCVVAREEGVSVLPTFLLSFYSGASSIFAVAAGIAGGMIGFLNALDLRSEQRAQSDLEPVRS